MNPYQFVLSLRLRHPARDLSRATELLGLSPNVSWSADAARAAPDGAVLGGTRTESYWTAPLADGDRFESIGCGLDEAMRSVLPRLMPHRAFLIKIRDEGGAAEIFVGLFASGNFGIERPTELLRDLSDMSVYVAIDEAPRITAAYRGRAT